MTHRSITFRPATVAEIAKYIAMYGGRVRFRHFVQERSHAKSWNGVQHVQYSRAKADESGMLTSGKWKGCALAATIGEFEGTRPFLVDLRIASEYLPSRI